MHPILFQIGNIYIYSWGFFVAVGFIVGIFLTYSQAKMYNISLETIFDLSMYVLISSIIGARLFYIVGFWNIYQNNLWKIFAVWEGGMVFYGGVIFGFIAIYIWTKKYNLNIFKILDLITPSVAIGYSIGRIGCFLNGCCYGLACGLPLGVHFPNMNGYVHPTQIYSSFAGIVIFILLLMVKHIKKFDGQLFLLGSIFYSIYRFIIEFYRFNYLIWWIFSPSQWISIAIFIFSFVLMILKMAENNK